MSTRKYTLLPGLGKQLRFLRENTELAGLKTLVIGGASEEIAKELVKLTGIQVQVIVDNFDSLMSSNLVIEESDNVIIKFMDFELTDFDAGSFDVVYAQGSVSLINRNKIVKEIKRILKPGGLFCVGEPVIFSKEPPRFVSDIFESSNMLPLTKDDLSKYYTERSFEVILSLDLTDTLREYYSTSLKKLESARKDLSENEQTYYKKLLKKISHESGAFLKQGADKHIGFIALICKRSEV